MMLYRGALLYLFLFTVFVFAAHFGLMATDFATMSEALSFSGPSWSSWLGNDIFGRDILSRGLHAGFTAMMIGFGSATIAVCLGGVLGVIAGYYEGWIGRIVVIAFTVLESIPYILILAALAFVLGQGVHNVYVSIGLTSWVLVCRLVRTECLKMKSADYILAAKSFGAGDGIVLFKNVLPNLKNILWSQFLIIFVFAIKVEVLLTFLGLGVEPGAPSWGYMLDEARQEVTQGFWWSFICATVMTSSFVLALHVIIYTKSESRNSHIF